MNKKIKILHIEITGNYGGIESLLTNVWNNIDRSKYQFDFMATSVAPYQNKLKEYHSNIILIPESRNLLKYICELNRVLNYDYDIVHFHKNSFSNIIPILVAKLHPSHPKIIIHSHNTSPSINNRLLFFLHVLNKSLCKKISDKKVACSKAAAKWMFDSVNGVKVINNGIDLDKFKFSSKSRKKIRDKFKIDNNTLLIGEVARFSEQKNQEFLIDIFKEINKLRPNTKLILIGDGSTKNKIFNKVKENNLESKVLILSSQKNVTEFLSAMDIFIMPSLYEGLPISAVEAQASGLNVFVSNVITKELFLTNTIHSFMLDDSAEKIAKMILKYKNVSNREKQIKMIQKHGYGIDTTVSEFEKLYDQLVR